MLAEGTLLDGKYELRGQIATGGMGEVYLAHRTLLGDDVAVKVSRRTGPDPSLWRERVLRESRACAQLRHPHIVELYGFGEQDDYLFYAMELVKGSSLETELNSGRRFYWREVTRIAIMICKALKHAHDHGIIHRDLS